MFEDWKKIYGGKLQERQNLDVRTTELWAIALQQLKITPKEFNVCMAKSISLEWPPTAPADFLELGRGSIADNYPDASQAYIDQANFKTDCPIAYETAKRVGFMELREQPRSKTYPQWQRHYENVCIEHQQGREFVRPQVQQIESKAAHEPADDATATKIIEDLRVLYAGRGK